jgi:hypothetical protein
MIIARGAKRSIFRHTTMQAVMSFFAKQESAGAIGVSRIASLRSP